MAGFGRRDNRSPESAASRFSALLAITQGLYFAATGLWPLINMTSFERITGPKTDRWLVKTVGVLVTVIGGALTVAGSRRRVTLELQLLGTASAAGLAGIDLVYVLRRRIAPIYLLDVLAELFLVSAWVGGRRGFPVARR